MISTKPLQASFHRPDDVREAKPHLSQNWFAGQPLWPRPCVLRRGWIGEDYPNYFFRFSMRVAPAEFRMKNDPARPLI